MEALHKEIYRANAPLVITGDSMEVLTKFIQTKLVPNLRANQKDGAIVMFAPRDKKGVLSSLSEALTSMFPGLTLELLHSVRTQQWAPLLRSLVRNEPAPGGQRILAVMNFDSLFDAPIGEQEIFSQALGMIAREKGISVIVGVSEKNLGRAGQLKGMSCPKWDGGCLYLSKAEWVPRRNWWQRQKKVVVTYYQLARQFFVELPARVKAISPLKLATAGAIAVFSALLLTAATLFVMNYSAEPMPIDMGVEPAEAIEEKAPLPVFPPETQDGKLAEASVEEKFEEIEVIEKDKHSLAPPPNLTPASRDSAEKKPQ